MHGFVYVMSIVNLALQCVWYNKTDSHDITEILLKVAVNTIPPPMFASKDLLVSVSFDKTLQWCNG
jgi:hypothetical protein